MKNLFTKLTLAAGLLAAFGTASAQEVNILAEKNVYPLGPSKVWYYYEGGQQTGQTETFDPEPLAKLTQVPTNTSNVFLYPEKGATLSDIAANQEIGAQGFYVDMGSSQSVGIVNTTWEGAAANDYSIYLTDQEPTLDILNTTPTYSAQNLGQYTENTAVLPDGSKGRYLVFQVTRATNWGWGIKIRSISAHAPSQDVLTTFKVTPSIVVANTQTPVTLTILNQFGVALPEQDVQIQVSDNAVFENNNLTITSGNKATFTATLGDNTITQDVFVAQAPSVPAATSIKTPIFTNTYTDYNGTAEFTTAYNGGASNAGLLTFPDGEIAQLFTSTRCVFFSNSVTTGAWNGNINPTANGYRNLCLDVFSAYEVTCSIEFESVENLAGGTTYNFDLKSGEWNNISVDVAGATKLGNLSIRFSEENMDDILLANIYFTPAYVEGDEEAPVLADLQAEPAMTSVTLTISATDDKSTDIFYSITDGTNTYAASGASGEEITYTVSGLESNTLYNFTVTASDGLNISDPKSISVTTLALPDAPTPETDPEKTYALFSTQYEATQVPQFDAWGSQGQFSTTTTGSGETVLMFSNYNGQWGGLVGLDFEVVGTLYLHLDIYTEQPSTRAAAGSITVAPVWKGVQGTPNTTIEVEGGQWNSYDLPLAEFGYPNHGTVIDQLAFTDSTLDSFLVNNIYTWGDDVITGVEEVAYVESATVSVYNLQGVCVRSNVLRGEALTGLPAGLYIVDGKKIMITK